ncbi:hypothetical protein GCM10009682_41250 [Luedemannella flava]|uniref:Uncharacterized protein n=1 Tax=Luedemannella flava TaxID=349316 RepID=A0ABN2M9X5_9ACTN
MRFRPMLAALVLSLVSTVTFVLPASPAAAAPADQWGFAYFDNPTPPAGWITLDPNRQWSTSRVAFPADLVTGYRIAAGRYYVRFPHLAAAGAGIVHVTAVNRTGQYCETMFARDSGADLIVGVACFKPGGAPDDSRFTVMFTLGSGGGATWAPGAYAFVRYGTAGIVAQDNSTGALNGAGPIGVGAYSVKLPGVAVAGSLAGNLQATAIGPNAQPRRCKIAKWGVSGVDVVAYVFCFDAAGVRTNTEFAVSYHRERPIVATYPPKYFGYVWTPDLAGPSNYNNLYGFGANSGAPVIGLPGHYAYKFPGIAVKETHAQVTAYGDDPNYCTIADWSGSPDLLLRLVCFTNTGATAPTSFFATTNSRI